MTDNIAVVRLRGIANMKPKLTKTLELLALTRPNHCVVVEATAQNMGMVKLVKDYVAYGKVSDVTLKALIDKRGDKAKSVKETVFRLHPPKKGLKDIKLRWPDGDLGERSDMDVFLKKMI